VMTLLAFFSRRSIRKIWVFQNKGIYSVFMIPDLGLPAEGCLLSEPTVEKPFLNVYWPESGKYYFVSPKCGM
jgi:hypothetical protein